MKIKKLKPKRMQLGGLIPLEFDASITLAPGIVFYREAVRSGSKEETWYWGVNNISVHITNYGSRHYPYDKNDPWYGWVVTATCGAEPPHYKTRNAAFKAAVPYVLKTIEKRIDQVVLSLQTAIDDFTPIIPELRTRLRQHKNGNYGRR